MKQLEAQELCETKLSKECKELEILDEECISLGLSLTLRDGAREYIKLEQQEYELRHYEQEYFSLVKEHALLQAELKGSENEESYLISRKETEVYYMNGAVNIADLAVNT
jgi:hypothetical protein